MPTLNLCIYTYIHTEYSPKMENAVLSVFFLWIMLILCTYTVHHHTFQEWFETWVAFETVIDETTDPGEEEGIEKVRSSHQADRKRTDHL